ncbi:hypothetical protein ACNVED_00170 [Legionella sp. D16C41]|uniref:hypothetical protein n=1 Tax=Legionella sp. D16C41 TaxID=3402688 RepID=UPI003AF6F6CB
MGCTVTFKNSLEEQEFNCDVYKQKILIEILLKYGNYSIKEIATALDIAAHKLQDILDGNSFLVGNDADDLAQLFLLFFGRSLYNQFFLTRTFH